MAQRVHVLRAGTVCVTYPAEGRVKQGWVRVRKVTEGLVGLASALSRTCVSLALSFPFFSLSFLSCFPSSVLEIHADDKVDHDDFGCGRDDHHDDDDGDDEDEQDHHAEQQQQQQARKKSRV